MSVDDEPRGAPHDLDASTSNASTSWQRAEPSAGPQAGQREPVSNREATSAADANLGRRLGPYRIERLIGRGGMGVVYLAVREDDYEQRVAVKLIQPDRLSINGLDRFYRERQILARLEHPNIARLLDGGTTDDALPFLVMEYVGGQPIDQFCASRRLPLKDRLELFSTVCEAVHFAHRNLVIHRDLKPANVLVADDRTVKLLDFGIAKYLTPAGLDGGPRTASGQEPMTPTYASPEQLLGRVVSTSSDVYALGVLLCKILTGRLPYGSVPGGTAHWVDAICRHDPVRPSALATTPAEGRRLSGDLDAIALKALRKEPEERYASALQLAEDIWCYLNRRPVAAREGNALYLTRKLIRRHKLATLLAAAIVIFSIAATALWRTAVQQRTRAEESLLRAEEVSTFLENLFRDADPNVSRGQEPSVRDALDRSRSRLLGGELGDTPEVRAELMSTLGTVYNDLGYLAEARELKVAALRVRRDADPGDRSELATDLNNLGRIRFDEGNYPAAEEAIGEAVAMWRRLGAKSDLITGLRNLAAVAMHQKHYNEAIKVHQEIADLQQHRGAGAEARAATSYSLGTIHRLRGDPAAAEPLLRRALEDYLDAHDTPEHTQVAAVQSSLARTLHRLGRRAEARSLYEAALDVRVRLLGEEHGQVAVIRALLAELLLEEGELDAAQDHLTAALTHLRAQKVSGAARSGTRLATAESIWGLYLYRVGRLEEAEAHLTASYQALRGLRGEQDLATRDAERRLALFREAPARETQIRASGRSPEAMWRTSGR